MCLYERVPGRQDVLDSGAAKLSVETAVLAEVLVSGARPAQQHHRGAAPAVLYTGQKKTQETGSRSSAL